VAADRLEDGDGPARRGTGASRGRTGAGLGDARPGESTVTRSPASSADAAGDDPESRAVARRLHRLLVDRLYGVASDAFARALPDLRATWADHQARYPAQERAAPRVTADGGWLAGSRRLSPEANAEAGKACADLADEGKRDVLPALQRVEAAEPGRRLAGLRHMLKGEDRLKEKIADRLTAKPGRSVQQVIDGISDPVRFTFCYRPQGYADGVLADVDRLKAEGFELIRLKNLWSDEQYKGINSQWRRPETGLRVEVQFHTPDSLEAKELTHGAYERMRSSASPVERQELEDFQRRVNAFLVTPEGTERIKDYPEERDG
jgi:hypothetical protein